VFSGEKNAVILTGL